MLPTREELLPPFHLPDLRGHYPWMFLIGIIAATVIYSFGLGGGFMLDDYSSILYNEPIKISALTLEEIRAASLSFDGSPLRRPVSMFSFAITHYLFGADPYFFKLTNLAIHLLTGIGIYLLSCLLFFSTPATERFPFPKWLPALVATAWLLAPVNLTTVLYAVQRMTGLAGLFLIYGLLLYTAGRVRQLRGRQGYLLMASAFLVFLPPAVFSKENGLLLIPCLLAMEAIFFRFRSAAGSYDRSIVILFLVCAAVPAALALSYLILNPEFFLAGYAYRDFSLVERLFTESRVLWLYIKLTLLPTLHSLGMYHDDILVSTGLLTPPTTLISLLALAALFIAAFPLAKLAPMTSFGILLFFLCHSMESTIFPLELAYEHRHYIAGLGIIIGLVSLPFQLQLTQRSYRLISIGLVSFLLITGATTLLRSLSWGDDLQLALDEARHHPDSPRANSLAGRVLFDAVGAGQPHLIADAIGFLEKARDTNHRSITPEISMIIAGQQLGLPIEQVWYDSAVEKLNAGKTTHSSTFALFGLYRCLKETGHCTRVDHNIFLLFKTAGNLNNYQAMVLYGLFLEDILRMTDAAEVQYRRTISRFPHQTLPYIALGRVMIKKEKWEEALIAINSAKKRDKYGLHKKEIDKAAEMIISRRKARNGE